MKVSKLFLLSAFLGSASFAGLITYNATLNGPSESPPQASLGTGGATVTLDTLANTMRVQIFFTGLTGTTTASHIHCCTAIPGAGVAGVATAVPTFTGFPLGVTSGTYDTTFDMSLAASYNPAFITNNGGTVPAAEAILLAGIAAGDSYLNVHSTFAPGGEIRGFLVLAPEPGTWVLSFAGLGLLWMAKRKLA